MSPKRSIDIIQDGQPITKNKEDLIKKYGLSRRDIFYSYNNETYISNFVGIVQRGNNILVSIPKHFKNINSFINAERKEKINDIRLIMDCIRESTFDLQYSTFDETKDIDTNFPLNAYFNIYRYFSKYGLYHEEYSEIKQNNGSKISWKSTLKRSMKLIVDGNLIFTPLFYKKVRNNETIVTECMISIINYTTSTLGDFFTLPDNTMIANRGINSAIFGNETIIFKLEEILSKTFKDINKKLIRNIITYLKGVNSIKEESLDIKYYNFANIWETAVNKYLNDHFEKIDVNDHIVFTKEGSHKRFIKKPIYYNSVTKYSNWYLEPDHFLIDKDNRIVYLFDSKYYTKLLDINHKQFMYHILYQNKYSDYRLYDSLLLPSEKDTATEEYVDIKKDLLPQGIISQGQQPIKIYLTKLNTIDVLKNYVND